MKFSIIIPVYNAQDTITKCVKSILTQNTDVEIILVDNLSTDNSVNICTRMNEVYPSVKFFQSFEKGASAARNVGLEYATGDIVGFCDADDTFETNSLDKVKELFEENPNISLLVTGFNRVNTETGKISPGGYNKIEEWSVNKLINHIIYDSRIMGAVWNKFFRIELLKNMRFDTSLTHCEDMHFLLKTLTNNLNVGVMICNIITYNYFLSKNSITASLERMFNENGDLKYITSMVKITKECKLKKFTYLLIRRNMFILASDVFLNFEISQKHKKSLIPVMRRNFFYFVLLLFLSVKSNIKRTIKVFLKLLKIY